MYDDKPLVVAVVAFLFVVEFVVNFWLIGSASGKSFLLNFICKN